VKRTISIIYDNLLCKFPQHDQICSSKTTTLGHYGCATFFT